MKYLFINNNWKFEKSGGENYVDDQIYNKA